MNERERKEIQVFSEALEFTSATERADYLSRACGKDEVLRQKVQALLQIQAEADGFFGTVTSDVNRAVLSAAARSSGSADTNSSSGAVEAPGTMIGRYKLLQKIGEGGCGIVYMAEQEEPVRRRVALKIIKLGMDTKSVIARFEAERQALAMMDHPNIAKVHDAGATDTGRPYFVMELVRGVKITDYCDEKNLSTQERLDLFVQVCQAVQHAHQKGIIHRDLKPSNILVNIVDGQPVPKVIDFGIAKATNDQRLTDKTVFTAFEQFIGTPAYMSPEQAEISGVDVDTRSDIYSLGVLLYELLTGKTPFDAKELLQAGLDEMRRTIREKEPERPSTRVSRLGAEELTTAAQRRGLEPPKLVHAIRGDLDWIVMKCLEKDRARRYETANGLAMDIQRHQSNEPVVACPPSAAYRFQKMVRRNKTAVVASGMVVAALLLGLGFTLWQSIEKSIAYRRARAAEKAARTEAARSQHVAQLLQEMLQGVGPSKALGRDTTMLKEILDGTADRVSKELNDESEVQVKLLATLGQTYEELGLYDKMEEIAQQAVAICRSKLQEENLDTATALAQLGAALYHRGRLDEAEDLMRKALRIRKQLAGGESAEVAQSLNDLAVVIGQKGKLQEAEAAATEAVKLNRKLFPIGNRQLSESLVDLGRILHEREKRPEAEQMFRQALEVDQKLFGNVHPYLVRDLNFLAHALEHAGKLDEAERAGSEALGLSRKLFGEDHPEVIASLDNVADLLKEAGKLGEAENLCREALSRCRRGRLPDYMLAQQLRSLADILTLQSKLEEAEPLLREGLEISRSGKDPVALIASLRGLSIVLTHEGKLQEAEKLHREALALSKQVWGEESLGVATALHNLASFMMQEGKLAEAESMERDALAKTRRISKKEDADVAWKLYALGSILFRQGKLAEAETTMRDALAIRRKLLGNEHPDVARSAFELAEVLGRQRKLEESETLFREALTMQRKGHADPGLDFADCSSRLVNVLVLEGKSGAIETLFEEFGGTDAPGRQRGASILQARGECWGRVGKWKNAAFDLGRARDLTPENHWIWHCLATVLACDGQIEAYREHCQNSLERFSKSSDAATAERIAKDCLLLASSGANLATVQSMIDVTLSANTNDPALPWFQLAKGLLEYRAGHCTTASEWLERTLTFSGGPLSRDEATFAVLAMVRWKNNEPERAREVLIQAIQIEEQKLPLIPRVEVSRGWLDWTIAGLFLREAKELIEGPPVAGNAVQNHKTEAQNPTGSDDKPAQKTN